MADTPVKVQAVAEQMLLGTPSLTIASSVAEQVLLTPVGSSAQVTSVVEQVMMFQLPVVHVDSFSAEVIGRGTMPIPTSGVVAEVISGIPYAVPVAAFALEVIGATTIVPPKPMQRTIWFHGA